MRDKYIEEHSCPICAEFLYEEPDSTIKLQACKCEFHKECIEQYVITEVDHRGKVEIKCPHPDASDICRDTVLSSLDLN